MNLVNSVASRTWSPPSFSFITIFSGFLCYWILKYYGIFTISWVLNRYLLRRYPISSTDFNKTPIPTCPYVWPNGQGDVAKFLEGEENGKSWGRKFGGIYRIWSGMSGEVVVTDPAHVKLIFADSDKHTKASNNNSGWLMGELLGKCVGLISGADWSRVRSQTGKHFTHNSTTRQIPQILKRVTSHFTHLRATRRLLNSGSSFLDPVQDLKLLPFWVVADMLYGELSAEMEAELRELIEIRENIWSRMIRGGLTRFSITRFWPWGPARELHVFKKRWEAFNRRARDACVSSHREAPVVQLFTAVEQGTLQLQELLQTCDEMLFANLDVTIGAISWNLVLLAAHKGVQDQVRREIVVNTSDPGDETKIHKYLQDTTSLLSASILESARLRPLAPFSVPQSTPTERFLGSYTIAANTNFIVDTYRLNVQHETWGPNGEVYDPNRFLGATASKLRYHFWRYGFGPRQCLGKYVADVVMRALLSELLRGWSLSFEGIDKNLVKKKDSWITCPDLVVKCKRIRQGL